MEFTKELIDKAKECKTAEEILALAKENGYELSLEEAGLFLQDFEEGELTDEELDNVAGGAEGCGKSPDPYEDVFFERKEDVQYLFNEGDTVEAYSDPLERYTATCKVVNRRIFKDTPIDGSGNYIDEYWLEKLPGVRAPFIKRWCRRHSIERK